MMNERDDEKWMRLAINEALAASSNDEVPVGAVFVHQGKVIARSHNQCELLTDPTAHAEMVGITEACAALEVQRLVGVELFVTKEPCVMCAGALVAARIDRVVFGARDEKAGACGSVLQLISNSKLNHRMLITSGVLEEECRALLQEFFQGKRDAAGSPRVRGRKKEGLD